MDHRLNNDNNSDNHNHILRREGLGMTSPPPPPPPPPPPASSLSSPTYSFAKRDVSTSDPYPSARNGTRIGPATTTARDAAELPLPAVRYRECLRNHAASVGGLVVDGCGEFMPSDSDALKCTVCGCHRSFHRKEVEGEAAPRLPAAAAAAAAASSPYYYHTYHLSNGGRRSASSTAGRMQPPPLLALPPPHVRHTPPMKPPPISAFGVPRGGGNESSGGGGGGLTTTDSSSEEMEAHTPVTHAPPPLWTTASTSRKRFRTKFSSEQKEKMLEFAGTLGWRMQRRDEGAVDRFCSEVGVPRKVFKVWMHNNKNSSGRSLPSSQAQSQQQPQHNPQPPQQQKMDHLIIPPHSSFASSSPPS